LLILSFHSSLVGFSKGPFGYVIPGLESSPKHLESFEQYLSRVKKFGRFFQNSLVKGGMATAAAGEAARLRGLAMMQGNDDDDATFFTSCDLFSGNGLRRCIIWEAK
jgi:hypothetical protein